MATQEEIKTTFKDAVDSDRFFDTDDDLKKYATGNLLEPEGLPVCAVKPKSAEEVVGVVKKAAEIDADLIPFSSGPPRFRGDTATAQESATVAVDLSDMKRIVRMDRRNKVAIVEPGVTFGELQAAAKMQHMKVLTPLLPRSTKSVIASGLEREPITVPKYHWDMTDPMLCVEVVFGTGDVFRTGGAAGPGTLEEQWASGAAQKCPLGPAQTDFLKIVQGAQGTMGIVTWASVKLELLPTIRESYFITSQKLEPLVDLLYDMTRRRLGDEILILDGFALANIIGKNNADIQSSTEKQAAWTLFYNVGGYEYYPDLRVKYQKDDIGGLARKHSLDIKREVPGMSASDMAAVIDLPGEEPYWKLRYKGAFREILFITTMDMARAHHGMMKEQAEKFDYPVGQIGVYLQPIQQGRACHLEFILPYDPDDRAETGKVHELFLSASKELADAGAFFNRPYGPWADIAYSRCPDTVAAMNKIKDIVDPDRVFNPGRICL